MKTEPMALFIEAWSQMTDTLPGTEHGSADAVATRLCDVPNLFFNLWFQEGAPDGADAFRRQLRAGLQSVDSWKHPVGGILREDWLPQEWEAILADEGLAVMMRMVGMEAETIIPPPRDPAEIDVRLITDDEAAHAAMMINAHAYHMPEEQFAPCGGMHFFPEGVLGFLGYVDGRPVATAGIRMVNGTGYVFLVATEPDEQGKGYAATTMRHAMEEGRRILGCDLLTLHATMDGAKTYEKMGFGYGAVTPMVVPVG